MRGGPVPPRFTWNGRIGASCRRRVGVGIAFDDLGTGLALLGMPERFPLTRPKIDRSVVRDISFVRGIETDEDDAARALAAPDAAWRWK